MRIMTVLSITSRKVTGVNMAFLLKNHELKNDEDKFHIDFLLYSSLKYISVSKGILNYSLLKINVSTYAYCFCL